MRHLKENFSIGYREYSNYRSKERGVLQHYYFKLATLPFPLILMKINLKDMHN